jgi:hypothetical protein
MIAPMNRRPRVLRLAGLDDAKIQGSWRGEVEARAASQSMYHMPTFKGSHRKKDKAPIQIVANSTLFEIPARIDRFDFDVRCTMTRKPKATANGKAQSIVPEIQ